LIILFLSSNALTVGRKLFQNSLSVQSAIMGIFVGIYLFAQDEIVTRTLIFLLMFFVGTIIWGFSRYALKKPGH